MTFKENLLKKIKINRLGAKVISSFITQNEILKIDKQAMRSLLEISNYKLIKERDIELFVPIDHINGKKVLVLDNGLALYNTTVEDVGLRKSPTVKEMLSIRNIIKILNDSDVLISKKGETVKIIQQESIDALDLNFTESDIDEIRLEGTASIESGYQNGVIEALEIFAELLGYMEPPGFLRKKHHKIIGALGKNEKQNTMFGPIVIFNMTNNELKLIKEPINTSHREKIKFIEQVISGEQEPSAIKGEVFSFLKSQIF